MNDFNKQRCLFKAYDIRGEAVLFDDDFVTALALSFCRHYKACHVTSLAIGYDARLQSRPIAERFFDVFCTHGIRVDFIGLTTTPMLAYAACAHQKNGIMITASHSPKTVLGIKWLTYGKSPSKDDIQAIFYELPPLTAAKDSLTKPSLSIDINHSHLKRYTTAITDIFHQLSPQQKINTLVVDCLDGATGVVAASIFADVVDNLIMLNNTPNGNYPKGNPDPAEPQRLAELCQAVLNHQADLGIAFDGDGDRLVVVDNRGRPVDFDWLIFLLTQAAKKDHTQNSKILYDIKCNHALTNLLSQNNIEGVLTQTGSSHLRRQLQETHADAIFAGELSGHFIFNDGKFIAHDDGIYAATRLIAWLISQKKPLSIIVDELPSVIATPDLYLSLSAVCDGVDLNNLTPMDFVNHLKHHLSNITLPSHILANTMDGVRLDFCQHKRITGFGLIRASNTSDTLTVRFGADDSAVIEEILHAFVEIFSATTPHGTLTHHHAQLIYNICQAVRSYNEPTS